MVFRGRQLGEVTFALLLLVVCWSGTKSWRQKDGNVHVSSVLVTMVENLPRPHGLLTVSQVKEKFSFTDFTFIHKKASSLRVVDFVKYISRQSTTSKASIITELTIRSVDHQGPALSPQPREKAEKKLGSHLKSLKRLPEFAKLHLPWRPWQILCNRY